MAYIATELLIYMILNNLLHIRLLVLVEETRILL